MSSIATTMPASLRAFAPRSGSRETEYGFIADPARHGLALQAFRLDGAPVPAVRGVRPAQQDERILFWDFPTSPFCIKVRAMLRFKGLVFDVADLQAPRQWLALQRRGRGKAPVLDIDGRLVVDSTPIARELDRLYPAQLLIPCAPRTQALCHALEKWADESMYFLTLHFLRLDQGGAGPLPTQFDRSLLGRATDSALRWLTLWQVRGQRIGRQSPAEIEAELRQHLWQASALLADAPFLLGDHPWLCDFALFGQLTSLLSGRASRDMVRQHPRLSAYVDRMQALSLA